MTRVGVVQSREGRSELKFLHSLYPSDQVELILTNSTWLGLLCYSYHVT